MDYHLIIVDVPTYGFYNLIIFQYIYSIYYEKLDFPISIIMTLIVEFT